MPALAINDPRLQMGDKKPGWSHTDSGIDDGHQGTKFGKVVHVAMCDPTISRRQLQSHIFGGNFQLAFLQCVDGG